jgi:hypothetical protein
MVYFGSQFQNSQFIVIWSHLFGPVVRQNIMTDNSKAAHLMVARKQRKRGRDQVPKITLKVSHPAPLPKCYRLVTKSFTYKPLGDKI